MREVVVVGAGIVGASLAHALTGRAGAGAGAGVLERDAREPRGSTAHAPGFVGTHDDAPVLTEPARESAPIYDRAGSGFRRTGGIEIATSAAGSTELRRRVDAARAAGPRAELLTAAGLPDAVAGFVDAGQITAAALFPDDGSADAPVLARGIRPRSPGARGSVTARRSRGSTRRAGGRSSPQRPASASRPTRSCSRPGSGGRRPPR